MGWNASSSPGYGHERTVRCQNTVILQPRPRSEDNSTVWRQLVTTDRQRWHKKNCWHVVKITSWCRNTLLKHRERERERESVLQSNLDYRSLNTTGTSQELTHHNNTLNMLKDIVFRGWPNLRKQCLQELWDYWNLRCDLVIDDGLVLKGDRRVATHYKEAARYESTNSLQQVHQSTDRIWNANYHHGRFRHTIYQRRVQEEIIKLLSMRFRTWIN